MPVTQRVVTLREVLTAARTYFVATTGSDSNDGLTSGNPFLTISHALAVIATIDFAGLNVTIQLADGTYTGAFWVPKTTGQIGVNSLLILGNTSTPSSVVIAANQDWVGALNADAGAMCTVSYCKFTGNGANAFALYAQIGGYLQIGTGCDFGGGGFYAHIHARMNAMVTSSSPYTISGGAGNHFNTEMDGILQIFYCTITISTSVTFSDCFVVCVTGGKGRHDGITFVNPSNVTGKRFTVGDLSYIQVGGASTTYFPGTIAGSVSGMGTYA